ncbi:uncharacterized protein LOC143138360 [Alosa pseudoharengus]|uniref:uncharacterized protein LOC143138360 n=1 Tax=Alosa pseudoharengus TaxID=34774 RepID=UPI003F89C690
MSCIGHPPGAPGPCERERACVCARVSERSGGRRQRIRSHMREVMEQLEYVLAELKDVARELQEVVGQIDKLTGDMPLDADTDQSIAASSSCSSERGPRGSCPNSPRGSFSSPIGSWVSVFRDSRRLSDRELHALCCDDDDDDDDEEEVEGRSSGLRSSRLSSSDSVFSSTPPPRPLPLATLTPSQRRRTQRSCSTQTVSDKSTQTAWPYVSPKQRN